MWSLDDHCPMITLLIIIIIVNYIIEKMQGAGHHIVMVWISNVPPTQSSVSKILCPLMSTSGDAGNFRVRLRGKNRSVGLCPRRIYFVPAPFPLGLSLLPSSHESRYFLHHIPPSWCITALQAQRRQSQATVD
jgi:hypothetical protein